MASISEAVPQDAPLSIHALLTCPGTDHGIAAHYAQYSYDHLGRRDGASLGNGREVTYAYHRDSLLKDLVHPDLIDVSATLHDAQWTFEYTKSNQMEWKDQPQAFAWAPAPAGIGSFAYVSTGLNQYDSVKAVAYNYTEPAVGGSPAKKKGNLVSDGVWTYVYDAENRMTRACDSVSATLCAGANTDAAYAYDPLDRRVAKTVNGVTTTYLWAGQNIIAEYGGAGTLLRRYVHGPGVDEPVAQIDVSPSAGTHYFHQDHLGTVVAMTDGAGALEDTYSYSTHGEIGTEGAEGALWRFTGRQLDAETGLYYYRARMYDPKLGRFLQTDPAGDTDSLNLYQYALWDPIQNKDPTGKFVPFAIAGCAANPACRGAIGAGVGAVLSAASYTIEKAGSGQFTTAGFVSSFVEGGIVGGVSAGSLGLSGTSAIAAVGLVGGTANVLQEGIQSASLDGGQKYENGQLKAMGSDFVEGAIDATVGASIAKFGGAIIGDRISQAAMAGPASDAVKAGIVGASKEVGAGAVELGKAVVGRIDAEIGKRCFGRLEAGCE